MLVPALLPALALLGPGEFTWHSAHHSPAAEAGDQFGRAVSAGGDRVLVSAWRQDGLLGGAHVFRIGPEGLVQEGELVPAGAVPGAMCGVAADLDGRGRRAVLSALGDDTLGQGAGAVHLFERGVAGWEHELRLVAPDGSEHDAFGSAVAIGQDVLAVGARGVDLPPFLHDAGAVYVFERNGGSWELAARLELPGADIGDRFGEVLDLHAGLLAVGVPARDHGAGDNAGEVLLYRRNSSGWDLEARLAPADLGTGSGFGRSIALHRERLLVGSSAGEVAPMAGVVHVFERQANGTWSESGRLGARVPTAFDFFGERIALHGSSALVSARNGLPGASRLHVFDLSAGVGPAAQVLDLPVGSSPLLQGNTLALGRCFAVVGEALHAGNVEAAPGRVDLFLGCEPAGQGPARR